MIVDCKKHGESKAFHPKGRNPRCSKCAIESVQTRRWKIKAMAVEYKGGKCFRCGYHKIIAALQFHHLDPKKKDFSISGTGATRAWATIKKELDKCVLVCANCHAEIHAE